MMLHPIPTITMPIWDTEGSGSTSPLNINEPGFVSGFFLLWVQFFLSGIGHLGVDLNK